MKASSLILCFVSFFAALNSLLDGLCEKDGNTSALLLLAALLGAACSGLLLHLYITRR